jgi:hypothetical protein
MTDTDIDDDRSRKERSPSFPFIALDKAIMRANEVAEAHKRNPARPAVVGQTWGYGPKSSGLIQTIAALKAYGLMEDIGRGEDRKVQLTDLAWRILHDTRAGAREEAVREAAMRPRLIAEYAQKWVPDRPANNHCLSELHLDRGFTPQAAELFLRVFDTTVAFANLKDSDNLSQVPEDGPLAHPPPQTASSEPSSFERMFMGLMSPIPKGNPPPATITPRATLPLPEGIVALELPLGLSRTSFEHFKAWVTTMVSFAEKDIVERWYVETYLPTSTEATSAQIIPSWQAVKGFLDDMKRKNPETLFRVIAPKDAKDSDLRELAMLGVRTF